MWAFVTGESSSFGEVRRRKSLVVHIGGRSARGTDEKSGGAVFMGDSAHSFPPDSGQGVSAGFQDVEVFMRVLAGCGKDASVEEVLRQYEEMREDDIRGLMRIARFCGPYQYGHSRIGTIMTNANVDMRKKLAKLLPGTMHPTIMELMASDLAYGQVARLADTTTRRLQMAALSIILLPAIGVMALHLW